MTLQALVETLDALTASHEELLTIARAKRTVIVNNEIDSLNRLVQRESRLLKIIDTQDAERARHVRDLASSEGLAVSDRMTLADIERLMTRADEKQMISRQRTKLLEVLDELRRLNDLNQQLVKHSIRFLNYSVDLFSLDPNDGITYRSPANKTYVRSNRILDTRA